MNDVCRLMTLLKNHSSLKQAKFGYLFEDGKLQCTQKNHSAHFAFSLLFDNKMQFDYQIFANRLFSYEFLTLDSYYKFKPYKVRMNLSFGIIILLYYQW